MPFDLPRKRTMRSDVSSYIQGSRGVAWNGHYFVAVIYARDTCVVLGRLGGGAPLCSGAAGRRFSLGLGALLGGCTWTWLGRTVLGKAQWRNMMGQMWGDSWGKWTLSANVNTVWVRERVLMVGVGLNEEQCWIHSVSFRARFQTPRYPLKLGNKSPSPHTLLPSWVDHFVGGEEEEGQEANNWRLGRRERYQTLLFKCVLLFFGLFDCPPSACALLLLLHPRLSLDFSAFPAWSASCYSVCLLQLPTTTQRVSALLSCKY